MCPETRWGTVFCSKILQANQCGITPSGYKTQTLTRVSTQKTLKVIIFLTLYPGHPSHSNLPLAQNPRDSDRNKFLRIILLHQVEFIFKDNFLKSEAKNFITVLKVSFPNKCTVNNNLKNIKYISATEGMKIWGRNNEWASKQIVLPAFVPIMPTFYFHYPIFIHFYFHNTISHLKIICLPTPLQTIFVYRILGYGQNYPRFLKLSQ